MNTKIPAGATYLLVYSQNRYGENISPGAVILSDAVMPQGKALGVSFVDEDPEQGELCDGQSYLKR